MTSASGQPQDPERGWVRPLGSTGLPVTAIGLGLAALGRPGYLNIGHGVDLGVDRSVAALERRTHAVLDAAYDAGVRYFDAARSYGRGEEFLASWLKARELAPGSVTVGSKWGYTYTADWRVEADPPEVKDLSVATSAGSSRRPGPFSVPGCRFTRSARRRCRAASSTIPPS